MLTVQLLPVSALADEFEIDDERHDTFTYEQPDVSGEIPELRGEYEKHFSLSDGTYSAVVYPYSVHYDSNGTWQEIDNTLRSGSETYMVAVEPGVELAELLPAEQDGGVLMVRPYNDCRKGYCPQRRQPRHSYILLHPEPSCIHLPRAHFFAGLHILRNEYLFACI